MDQFAIECVTDYCEDIPDWFFNSKEEYFNLWSTYEDSYWILAFSYNDKLYFIDETTNCFAERVHNKKLKFIECIQEVSVEVLLTNIFEIERCLK